MDNEREYCATGPTDKDQYLVGYVTEKGFKTVLRARDKNSAIELAQTLQQYHDAGVLV